MQATGLRSFCTSLVAALALFLPMSAQAADNVSVHGRYRVTLPAGDDVIPVATWQVFTLQVARMDGKALALRDFAIDGGMPAHGHGLPTVPKVRSAGYDGAFLVEGLRFNMAGRWELRVLLADAEGTDFAVFQLDVGASAEKSKSRATWTEEERTVLRSLSIASLGPVPADPSNAVAADPRAVALGHRLFFDPALSGDGKTSCATCHDPGKHFADGLVRGHGVTDLDRNTPSLVGAAYASFLFWDGRRDSLWSQALGPIEAPAEMNSSRLETVRYVAGHYATEYSALFGALPKLDALPKRASPTGDAESRAAWSKLSSDQQNAINRAFAHVGKVIAAYERQLMPGKSAFDRYVEAVEAQDLALAQTLLSPKAVSGLKVFISSDAQCLNCHNGPLFTNQGFHNIGTAGLTAERPDFGRSIGIQALLSTEFNCAGPYSDAKAPDCPELSFLNRHEENGLLVGAYKVPSLRNAALSAPYMHDGRFQTLRAVVEHYRDPALMSDTTEFRPLFDMTPSAREALVHFLQALSAPVAAPPELLRAPTK